MSVLRKYIRKILQEMNYQSHTFEPMAGDSIVNTNPGCKHFRSQGVVLDIEDLPDGTGKLIVYKVTNSGSAFEPGDVLKKTLDQLSPV